MKNLCCAIAAFLLIPSASLLAQETYVLDALHTATSFQTAQFSAAMPRGSFPLTRKPACGAEATATIKTSDFGMTPRGPDTDHIAISVVIEALLQ